MKFPIMIAAAAVALSASASAAPIDTPPGSIPSLGGDVKLVYVYYEAADKDELELTVPASMTLFCNKSISGTCSANAFGDTIDLGVIAIPNVLEFALENHTKGKTYSSVGVDAQGHAHAWLTTNYADFGQPLPAASAAALAGLPNVVFLGWEDLEQSTGSDWDYNDLIFAISLGEPEGNPGVPEPLTLSLLGAGLLGAFGLRRVRKA